MKYLVVHYEYEDCGINIVNIDPSIADEVFQILELDVLAKGDFESKEKILNVRRELKNLMWKEKTPRQASKEWEESRKIKENRDKYAVSFSGTIMAVDSLPKNEYIEYVRKETIDAKKHNIRIKQLLEKL